MYEWRHNRTLLTQSWKQLDGKLLCLKECLPWSPLPAPLWGGIWGLPGEWVHQRNTRLAKRDKDRMTPCFLCNPLIICCGLQKPTSPFKEKCGCFSRSFQWQTPARLRDPSLAPTLITLKSPFLYPASGSHPHISFLSCAQCEGVHNTETHHMCSSICLNFCGLL